MLADVTSVFRGDEAFLGFQYHRSLGSLLGASSLMGRALMRVLVRRRRQSNAASAGGGSRAGRRRGAGR